MPGGRAGVGLRGGLAGRGFTLDEIAAVVAATIASGDLVPFADISDGNKVKRATAAALAALASGAGIDTSAIHTTDDLATYLGVSVVPTLSDLAVFGDVSGGGVAKKNTWQQVLNLIASLTEKTSVVTADKFAVNDSAASDATKYITAANLAAAMGGELDLLARRGIERTGLTPSSAFVYKTLFGDNGGWASSVGGSGAVTYDVTNRRVKLTSGAFSTASANFFHNAMLYLAEGTSSSRFYWAFRAAVTTAIDAEAIAAMVNGGSCSIGVNGALSTTKYVCDFNNGSALTSSVDIDTAEHLFEIWRDGTTTYFAVDGETPVSGTGIYQTAADRFQWQVQNQATAAVRTLEVKSLVVVAR